ncbi:MAG: FtsX-like permease family protein [Oscillospiraceae bacterium]|nr:FtsX-like permease family protein [Oscillospiraceae bacterium]
MRWFRSFGYNLTQGIKGVFRNSVMSTASVLVLLSCMVIIGTFFLAINGIEENMNNIGNLTLIEVRVSPNYTQEQLDELEAKLKEFCANSDVLDDEVEFTSGQAHLESLMEEYQGQAWTGVLYELPEGFSLRPSFTLTFSESAEVSKLKEVRAQIGEIRFSDGTAPISDGDIKDALSLYENVTAVKRTLTVVGLWFMGILLLISLFVIMNTIKLGVFARKNEIMFMRLCGATKAFIRTPFLVEGAIIGLFSAGVALGLEYLLYDLVLARFIQSSTSVISDGILLPPYVDNLLPLAILFGGIGLFAGLLSSSLSLKKYLKV